MHIAIVGSREYPRLADITTFVRRLPVDTAVVSGGGRGVDRVAEQAAKARGLQTLIFPAEWERYGRSAGSRRNANIVAASDQVVAFWDG
jgi:hypothetical protein